MWEPNTGGHSTSARIGKRAAANIRNWHGSFIAKIHTKEPLDHLRVERRSMTNRMKNNAAEAKSYRSSGPVSFASQGVIERCILFEQ
jgi:hypothetical protein